MNGLLPGGKSHHHQISLSHSLSNVDQTVPEGKNINIQKLYLHVFTV